MYEKKKKFQNASIEKFMPLVNYVNPIVITNKNCLIIYNIEI